MSSIRTFWKWLALMIVFIGAVSVFGFVPDQPTAQIRPSGAREETDHNALGYRTQFRNAEGKPVTFDVDAQGRVTRIENAIGKANQFAYNGSGDLISRIDAEGIETTYSYDSMHQLVAVTNAGVQVATFTHDSNGSVLHHREHGGTEVSFSYNEMNQLVASTQLCDLVTSVIENSFDLNGNRANIVYPGGLEVSYSYENDQLKNVTTKYANDTKTIAYSYDSASRLTGMTYSNGVNSSFGLDAEGRVTNIVHGSFVNRRITRNPLGFKTVECIDAGIKPTVPETARHLKTHNDADQLVSERIQRNSTNWMEVAYSYNDNGGLRYVTEDSVIKESYGYDYDNRLTTASDVEYLYDATGSRIGRISGTTTNYFVIDYVDGLKRPLAETDAQGNITRYYIWAGAQLLCHIEADGTTRYYHADELGSTLALTDESGAVTDEYAYMPYGYATHTAHVGSVETPFQWLGGYGVYYDAATDLHLTLHRAYSSKLKRFISPDPLGIDGGVNVYAMANLNPLFFVDPYGLCADSFWSQGVESALGNGLDWLQSKAQQASDSFSSFSDEYIYAPVAQQGDQVNDWLGSNVREPGSESLTAVNNWLDDRSTAEKFGVAFAPTGGGLLFTEGGMCVAGQILVNGIVQYLIQDASSGTPGLYDTFKAATDSLSEDIPTLIELFER